LVAGTYSVAIINMKALTNLLTSLILASSVAAIALLSIQNITPVSVKFLTFQSIRMPVGVVLALSAGAGAIGSAIVPIVWGSPSSNQSQSEDASEFADEDF
jgi:uncharacterized integral membrane protein